MWLYNDELFEFLPDVISKITVGKNRENFRVEMDAMTSGNYLLWIYENDYIDTPKMYLVQKL